MSLFLVGSSPSTFTYYAPHTHEYYELILNLEGEGVATMGGVSYPFAPGTIHIVPANTPHHKESAHGFRDIYFHTDTLFLGAGLTLTDEQAHQPIVLMDDADHTMEKLMSIMLARYLKTDKSDVILNSMYHIALELVGEWYQKEPTDAVVENILHEIALSFNDPEFQITEALIATGYSKDYIRRRFFAATHMTPAEYLTDLRMRYASQLLAQKRQLRLSIADIGVMCGYYDARYFARIFRKHYGVTPSEYADAAAERQAEK